MSCCTEIPRAQIEREHELRCLTNAERLKLAIVVELPYSEVCVHMRVHGQSRPVIPVGRTMAQILDTDGSLFSFPVTRGEAGLPYESTRMDPHCTDCGNYLLPCTRSANGIHREVNGVSERCHNCGGDPDPCEDCGKGVHPRYRAPKVCPLR